MDSIGYSGTPLIKKLSIKLSDKLLLLNAPMNYFELLEGDFAPNVVKSGKNADWVHLFCSEKKRIGETVH